MKLIVKNKRPIGLIILCSCVGFLFDRPGTGIIVGVALVAAANCFLTDKTFHIRNED